MVLKIKYLNFDDKIEKNQFVICLGYFDGMHKAHQELIKKAQSIAKENKLSLAVFTFNTGILRFIKNEPHRCLTTIEDKASICESLGVDYLYVMNVTKDLVKLSAKDFINNFLINSHTVVCGFDFNFGFKGEGSYKLLKQYDDFNTIVIPKIKYQGIKIGSTRIKDNLDKAEIDIANFQLGRRYIIKGEVIKGRGIGKTLSIPTANISFMPYWLPKTGVYYTQIYLNNQIYQGITNIGVKPTFKSLPLTVETHIFGINQNLYGETLKIEFIKYIRPEKKFIDEFELKKQILDDINQVKNEFKEDYNE